MEENQSFASTERGESKLDSQDGESKKQNCLCAPTTHAGSFRCRLHRRPPPSPFVSQHAVKKGLASQKTLSPNIKLALHHKLRLGCSKRASLCSTSSSRPQQEVPGLSRLSRTSSPSSIEQNPSSQSDTEAVATVWKTSCIRDETTESVSQIVSSEVHGEELSSARKSYTRPLVRVPSI